MGVRVGEVRNLDKLGAVEEGASERKATGDQDKIECRASEGMWGWAWEGWGAEAAL